MARQAGHGEVGYGVAWCGMAGKVWRGLVWPGMSGRVAAGEACHVMAVPGKARFGGLMGP